jgi:hypothetical protein
MRSLYLLGCLFFIALGAQAQKTQTIFRGYIEITNDTHVFQLGLHKGDLIMVDLETDKRKIDQFEVVTKKTRVVARRSKIEELEDYKFRIPESSVYDFKFTGRGLARRNALVTIKRQAGSDGPELMNPAFVKETLYDTTEVVYQCDTVVGTMPAVTEQVELELFDRYVYQTKEFLNESFQLKGSLSSDYERHFTYKVPEPAEGLSHKGFSYTVTSKIGGEQHWKLAKIGVSVGAMFVNPAAGFAAEHMMDLMGPQPGGEPSLLMFSKYPEDAALVREMLSAQANIKNKGGELLHNVSGGRLGQSNSGVSGEFKGLFQLGAVTSQYGLHYNSLKECTLILGNYDPAKAKNVKLSLAAIQSAPLYRKVKSEQKIIKPELKKLDKKEISISSEIVYNLLD